jgi:hypothetical protein
MSSSTKRKRELPLCPAHRTPGIIRTGDLVRIVQKGHKHTPGRFVGYGLDSINGKPLLFVQADNGGVGPYSPDDVRLEREGGQP